MDQNDLDELLLKWKREGVSGFYYKEFDDLPPTYKSLLFEITLGTDYRSPRTNTRYLEFFAKLEGAVVEANGVNLPLLVPRQYNENAGRNLASEIYSYSNLKGGLFRFNLGLRGSEQFIFTPDEVESIQALESIPPYYSEDIFEDIEDYYEQRYGIPLQEALERYNIETLWEPGETKEESFLINAGSKIYVVHEYQGSERVRPKDSEKFLRTTDNSRLYIDHPEKPRVPVDNMLSIISHCYWVSPKGTYLYSPTGDDLLLVSEIMNQVGDTLTKSELMGLLTETNPLFIVAQESGHYQEPLGALALCL